MASWVRVDTRFVHHPKVLDIGPLGEALWLRGLCYAGGQLTDGFIPISYIKRMSDLKGVMIAAKLVCAGLWDEVDGGYRIHDYFEWQQSRQEMADISQKRADAGRRGGQQKASKLLANSQDVAKTVSSKPVADKIRVDKIRTEENVNGPPTPPVAPASKLLAPPPPSLPGKGESQKIVAAYCEAAHIDAPADYPKAVGIASRMVKAGIVAADIPAFFGFVASWSDGPDLGIMFGSIDKWRASKQLAPKQARAGPNGRVGYTLDELRRQATEGEHDEPERNDQDAHNARFRVVK